MNLELILDLEKLAFLLLKQHALVVVGIDPDLLGQLLRSPFDVLVCVASDLSDVVLQLVRRVLRFKKLVVLDLALLLHQHDFLIKGVFDVDQVVLLVLLEFDSLF